MHQWQKKPFQVPPVHQGGIGQQILWNSHSNQHGVQYPADMQTADQTTPPFQVMNVVITYLANHATNQVSTTKQAPLQKEVL